MTAKATRAPTRGGLSLDDVALLLAHEDETRRLLDKADASERLLDYTKYMWPVLEPGRPFVNGWAIGAVAEHLEAVTMGQINRLLINVPPGFMKSLETDVFWPSWEWGPRKRPDLRYVSASYSGDLTLRDNGKCRDLISSHRYQVQWGPQREELCSYMLDESKPCDCGAVFHVRKNFDARGNFKNNHHGFKLASSVGGVGTGERGDRIIIDDPHSVKQSESEAIREETLRWFSEVMASRTNDASTAFVVIMQRVHERDVSGLILSGDLGYTHLCIPQRYERNHPHKYVGWQGRCHKEQTYANEVPAETCFQLGDGDPRVADGELAWPELWPEARVDQTEKEMSVWGGSYAISGQEQQRPTPRGGGMFQRKDFKLIRANQAPQGGRTRRGWDLAGSQRKTSPYTASVRIRLVRVQQSPPMDMIIVENVTRDHWTPHLVNVNLKAIADLDGKGKVIQDLPQDPGQAGLAQKAAFATLLAGHLLHFSPETGSKEERAAILAAQSEGGNVYLIEADWNAPYVAELCSFPRGQFADQVDASSRCYAGLLKPHGAVDLSASGPRVVG